MQNVTDRLIPGTRIPDMTGMIFGRLTVLEFAGRNKHSKALWRCRCSCDGREVVALAMTLRNGRTTSCGCWHREQLSNRNRTHGQTDTPLYKIWRNMNQRCYNPNVEGYHNYGGRGITVCQQWRESFAAFARDMGPTYRGGLSIERIDVNGNYTSENCTWATLGEQRNNTRRSRRVTFRGVAKTVAEWSEITGVKYATIQGRLDRYGWSAERALTTGADLDSLARFFGEQTILAADGACLNSDMLAAGIAVPWPRAADAKETTGA